MKTRTVAWCVGVLALVASLVSAEAAGPLTAVTSLSLGTHACDLVVEGDLAYVGTDDGLTIVNVANPNAPQVLASLDTGGQVLGLALKGSHVYLANRNKDFQVVNVANSAAPVLLARKPLSGYSYDVALKDNVAYVVSAHRRRTASGNFLVVEK